MSDHKQPLNPSVHKSSLYGSTDKGQRQEVVIHPNYSATDDSATGDEFLGVSFHDLTYVVKSGLCGGRKEILHSIRWIYNVRL